MNINIYQFVACTIVQLSQDVVVIYVLSLRHFKLLRSMSLNALSLK